MLKIFMKGQRGENVVEKANALKIFMEGQCAKIYGRNSQCAKMQLKIQHTSNIFEQPIG